MTDGIYVWISGRVANDGPLKTLVEENTQLACHQIADVESADRTVRFEYNVIDVRGDAIFLWLADSTAAARLSECYPDAGQSIFTRSSSSEIVAAITGPQWAETGYSECRIARR